MISENDLNALVAGGEDVRVEFKSSVPHPGEIARIIGGLANAAGGRLLLGIDESSGDAIRGVDVGRAELAVRRALELLEPRPAVDVQTATSGDRQVLVVTVDPAAVGPVLARGVAYVREGEFTVPANANRLLARVRPDASADDLLRKLEQFGNAIERQSQMIEKLQADGGWRQKLLWTVIGAVIGLLFSLPLIFIG